MFRLEAYRNYEKGNFVAKWTLLYLENYILGNMHYYTRNYSYWYSKYDELKHFLFVIRWKKERYLIPCARMGERIVNNELVLDE